LAGFVSEFMCFLGAFKPSTVLNPTFFRTVTMVSTLGILITAAFMLWMIQRVLLGKLNPRWESLKDMTAREIIMLAPMVVLMVLFGVWPKPMLDLFNAATENILHLVGG
jgi:NADH-quinone oxidoreductase subunit M